MLEPRQLLSTTIDDAGLHYRTAPQHIYYQFNQPITGEFTADDIVIDHLTTNTTLDRANLELTYDSNEELYSLSFPGHSNQGMTGMIPDGNFDSIISELGVPGLLSEHRFSFFFLIADANHDRAVSLNDSTALEANLFQSNKKFHQGDFNLDGTVDLADWTILQANFGRQMPEPLTEANSMQAAALSSSVIRRTWTAPATGTPDGYRIFRSMDGTNFTLLAEVNNSTLSYDDPDLNDGSKYWYRVRPFTNAYGNGVTTNKVSAVTVLEAPSELVALPEDAGTVRLTWTDNSQSETEFELYGSFDGGAYTLVQTVGANTSAATVSISADSEVAFYLRAIAGGHAHSAPTTVIALPVPFVEGPSDFSGEVLYGDEVALLWTPVGGSDTSYLIEERLGSQWFTKNALPSGDDPGVRLDSLLPQTSYSFRVRSVVEGVPSLPSLSVELTTTALAPARPEHVELNGTSLTWDDASNDETGFRIKVWYDHGPIEIHEVDSNIESFEFGSLSPATILVEAFNASGSQGPVSAVNVTPGIEMTRPTQILLAYHGLGSTEWFGNQWLEEIARRSRPGSNGLVVLETENRGERGLTRLLAQLDMNGEYHIDAAEVAGVRIKALGYSWGAIEVLNRVYNLRADAM